MKEVELDLVETEKCESDLRETRLGQNFTIHESFICAGGHPDKDTCQGLKSKKSNHCRSEDVRTI
jgi:kallikrein